MKWFRAGNILRESELNQLLLRQRVTEAILFASVWMNCLALLYILFGERVLR